MKHIKRYTNNTDAIIGTYFTTEGLERCVSAERINIAIRETVEQMQLPQRGFPTDRVSSHSLRSGGAMAMHLAGISDNTIKKQGHWSTDSFLMYIHEQISAFSIGISTKMSQPIDFHNVAYTATKGPKLIIG